MEAEVCETLRAWTIQPWEVWQKVEAHGSLTVDPRYSANLHACYEWLRQQLLRRLPGYGGHYPWWGYCDRPDLRERRHQFARGVRYALLELALPRELVMILPFWAWDNIFYGRFLSPDAQEAEEWERRLVAAVPDEDTYPYPEPWCTELHASWERLFDPDLPVHGLVVNSPLISAREVVFEVLERRFVRRVTPFLGASSSSMPRELDPWRTGEAGS